MGLKFHKYYLFSTLMTLVILTTSCQKKTTASFKPSKNKTQTRHKTPTRKDLNDCHIMEKQRDKQEKIASKQQQKVAKLNKREAKWKEQGKLAKLEKHKQKRAKRAEKEALYGPGTKTDWSFVLVIGVVLAVVLGGAVFLVSFAITFILSLALGTFFVPFAFAALGFVFSALVMGSFHLFNSLKNLFRRRRLKRKKKKEEEELNQEQYSNE